MGDNGKNRGEAATLRLANGIKKGASAQGGIAFLVDFNASKRKKNNFAAILRSGRFFFGVRFGIMNGERRFERVERQEEGRLR